VDLYRRALQLKPDKEFAQGKLVGMKGQELGRLLADANGIQNLMLDLFAPGATQNQFTNVGISVLRVSLDRNVEAFATNYAKQASAELNSVIGFPLVQDKARPLAGFQALSSLDMLNVMSADFGAFTTEPLRRLELMSRPEWQAFAGRVSAILKIWRTLLQPNGSPGQCSVNLLKAEDAAAPQEKWREKGRVAELDPPGGTKVDSDLGGFMGKLAIDRKLQLKLYQRVDAPEPWNTTATPDAWGTMHVLLDPKNKSTRVVGSTNKWRVNWKISHDIAAGATEGIVPLEITFEDGELPDLKDWPLR
jgi:hypothetical protein